MDKLGINIDGECVAQCNNGDDRDIIEGREGEALSMFVPVKNNRDR